MIRLNLIKNNITKRLYNKTCRNFSKLDLEIHRQKSHLAEIILDIIAQQRTFSQIKRRSLVDQIKEQFKYYPEYKQQVRDEMLEFFTKGVEYNTLIFDQCRHQAEIFGKNKQNLVQKFKKRSQNQQFTANSSQFKNSSNQQQSNRYVKNGGLNLDIGLGADADAAQTPKYQKEYFPQKKLIRFYPTTLITSQIFRNLLYSNMPYQLLMGPKGISKSISVQLYSYLSNIIVSYQCRPEHQRVPPLQILNECGVPKLLYWNIKPGEYQQQVRKKILSQCPEIGDNLENSSYLTDKDVAGIKKFYRKKNILVILFIDQMSHYANRFKHIVQKEEPKNIMEIKAKLKKNVEISLEQKIQLNNYSQSSANYIEQQTLIQKSYIMLFWQSFERKLFSSSVGIERSFLRQMDLTRTGNHTQVKIKHLDFEEYLSTQKALYQLIDCFMCEVKDKIKSPLFQSALYTDDQNKKKMRDYLFEKFKAHRKFYLTPLIISQKLGKQSSNYEKQPSQSNFSSQDYFYQASHQLEKLLKACLEYSRDQLHERVKNFLKKTDKNQQLIILSQFFIQKGFSSRQTEEREEKDTYDQEPSKKFSFKVKYLQEKNSNSRTRRIYNPERNQNSGENDDSQPDKMDHFIDKQLFEYHENGEVSCFFDYEDIYDDLESINADVIDFILSHSENMMSKVRNWTSFGRTFENLFIHTFLNGRFNVKFHNDRRMEFNNLHSKIFGFKEIPNPDKGTKKQTLNQRNDQNLKQKKKQNITPNNNYEKQKPKNQIQQYSFLQSFKKSFDYIQKNQIEEAIFIALNQKEYEKLNFLEDENQKIQLKHFAQYNPNIDIIFMKYISDYPDIINLYAIDLITQNKPQEILKKLTKFLKNFKKFKDNTQTEIEVNGKNAKINLHYYVLSPLKQIEGKNKKSLKDLLSLEDAAKDFEFKNFQTKTNILEVKSLKKDDKSCPTLLKTLGYISMRKQSLQLSRRSGPRDHQLLWFYDRLSKAVEYHT